MNWGHICSTCKEKIGEIKKDIIIYISYVNVYVF